MRLSRQLPKVALCVAQAAAIAGASPPAAPAAATVAPGSIVRWAGSDLVSCEVGGRRWQPLDGACLFPIDLEATRPVEIVRRSSGGVAARRIAIGDYPWPTQQLTVEDRYVAPSRADLARIEREKRRVAKLWSLETPRRFGLPLGAPLTALGESSRFGARRIFNGESRSPHSGADFAAASGTPVLAVADGKVVLAEEQFFAGRAVFVDHGDGLVSMSFHLSKIEVAAGAEVRRGQRIGTVGATGRVTGPHLHLGLRWHGARVDPAIVLGRSKPVEVD